MRKKMVRRVGVAVLSASMVIGSLAVPGFEPASVNAQVSTKTAVKAKTGSITLNGNDIKTDNVNGLTFKGFGVLSGNSSSDLLMDYKSQNPEAYAQMMQYLFGGEHPIMNHVKLEMGNDRNNSTGAESATMRVSYEDANVKRNPGWQLAADAKKINPNLKVSILKWNAPTWAKQPDQQYQWYKKSILAAYKEYGFMVDYMNPNTNEAYNNAKDVDNTKQYIQWIAAENEKTIPDATALALFKKIKMVVSDESSTVSESVAQSMKSDAAFFNAVSAVGYHYSPADDDNGGMKWLADEMDKEVWNSEAQATFSNSAFRPSNNVADPTVAGTGIGGGGSALEMGNTFIKGFVESRRSHVIYQPAIGSFYEGGQYSFKELISARDPWSGWMHYDAGLLVLAHVSKFAKTGWENEDNTAGIWRGVPSASKSTAEGLNPVNGRNGGENYMTLAAPSKDDFSTVIVNDSEYPMNYTVKVENMNLKANQKLAVWETRAADDGAFNENYMKHTTDVEADTSGVYSVSVAPYSVVTVTTVETSASEEAEMTLLVEGERTVLDTDQTGDVQNTEDQYLYADDYDYSGKTVPVLDGKGGFTGDTEDYLESRGGDTGAIPRYSNNINGSFETFKSKTGNYVLRQQLDKASYGLGGTWNKGDPVAVFGDYRWANYAAQVDVQFETDAADNYGAVSIRQIGGHQKITNSSGYTLQVTAEGVWTLFRKKAEVATGTVTTADGFRTGKRVWNRLKLEGAGSTIKAYINGKLITTYTDENPITSGRIGLGCAYAFTQFDNLQVTKLDGYVPYYTEYLDDQETYDLTPEKNVKLIYNDNWSHQNSQGMFVYQRSISWSTAVGAKLTYSFKGTGLEILAGTGSTADLRVTVDGEDKGTATTRKADDMNAIYTLDGLEYGDHTVSLMVTNGTLGVDAVGILGAPAPVSAEAEEIAMPADMTEDEAPIPYKEEEPVSTDSPAPSPSAPAPAPVQTTAPAPQVTAAPVKVGTVTKVSSNSYKVTSLTKKTVEFKAPAKKTVTKVTIPATVKITVNGKKTTFKVTGISSGAFKNCKKLKALSIGGKLTKVAKKSFTGCTRKIKVSGKYKKANIKLLKKSGYKKFK